MRIIQSVAITTMVLLAFISCRKEIASFKYDFNQVNDRIWIGEDFWTVPLEDWKIEKGRIEFTGSGQQSTCTILPYSIVNSDDPFSIRLDMGLIEKGGNDGSSGIIIGSRSREEDDRRAAIYFGRGLNIGVNTSGYAFIGQQTKRLPAESDLSNLSLEVNGEKDKEDYVITLKVLDNYGKLLTEVNYRPEEKLSGIIQLVNNFRTANSKDNGPRFWFDNLILKGKRLKYTRENSFGPILWAMHTLSRNTLKITAQLPPVALNDNQILELQIKENGKWLNCGKQMMETDSRTVTFKVENWNSLIDHEYRILYPFKNIFGEEKVFEYTGVIRRDPVDRELKMGAMTCQYHTGFPYSPLVRNLKNKNPDILYFSGDQIYEQNGGYPIKREPEDVAILNYLGKWYMFGMAFGELLRDIPVICTPDDHDVFQGNLWGGHGIAKSSDKKNTDDYMGFAQTVRFVNAVNRSQCSHLPDPFDPSPIEQGMSVWYTSLNYGRVSFAIVSDRVFKSGPNLVADWEVRKDHIKEPLKDPSVIDKPDLDLLGKRQEVFLESWIKDWNDVDMKVLLSQTPFANVATHHGQFNGYLFGDMDSGGWPKKARDRALYIIRKGFVFHICGDQHLPSIVQYGIEEFRDAGWCFCTPAISVGYSRWFRPDELNIPVNNRPEHGLPNTGEYTDAFGNKNYVYAVGNPRDFGGIEDRYRYQNEKTAGFGFVTFNKETREIKLESWRFMSDVLKTDNDSQHPGWPLVISQSGNYGRKAKAWLPHLIIKGDPDPVVEVINQTVNELEYIVRINGNEFDPMVFSNESYILRISYPEKRLFKEIKNIIPQSSANESELLIEFN